MPTDTPSLHHVGLNSTDPDAAIEWYLRIWPAASEASFAGRRAVEADMQLVFTQVDETPPGGFDTDLGRSTPQSAFWHIGAFANTTDMDDELAAVGVVHTPLFVGPDDPDGVWRSGLAPYSGIVTADALDDVEPAEPRDGGFSYVVAPDGVLFEFTGGPTTSPSLSHVHLFHEQPRCAANWYVTNLGMALPPIRAEDGTSRDRPLPDPCEAGLGDPGWPSLEAVGTIRQPRGTVVHGSGSISFYPRQCVLDRCSSATPLVASRGQALDHVGFAVADIDAWHAWLSTRDVTILEDLRTVSGSRTFMFEGPDGLAIELVEVAG